jgi:redox-sensitive bicupin YhaK (pirin superfamily)
VTTDDAPPEQQTQVPQPAMPPPAVQQPAAAGSPGPGVTREVEVTASRQADVGGLPVRRALPRRARRTVGAWCFADHMGPLAVAEDAGMAIGPHPHAGLQTVTWLIAGEALHRDSLGSEQTIRPGQLNLMTAGHGVSHAEESTGHYRGDLHGIQLWVAQPEATRDGAPAFEHHPELAEVELDDAVATVLIGELAGASSTARRDTRHVGVDVQLRPGRAVLPLLRAYEYALVLLGGAVDLPAGAGTHVVPGQLAYLGLGREELELTTKEGARLLLLGGEPFESPILMWWNFVARTRAEIDSARADWAAGADRFGETGSRLPRIPAPSTPWA